MKGRIFDISTACIDDGPGLRTTVFLKGCNLDCPWCHNMEGKSFGPEISFDRERCIGCGTCIEVCPRSWSASGFREGCTACGLCVENCPSGARRLVGRQLSAERLVTEASADADFFEGTGGGVTFSGGEPLAQAPFLFACARELKKRGIHLAVETSGYWPPRHVAELCRTFDLVLFDLKHVEHAECEHWLGRSCARALGNLTALLAGGVDVEVRITLVPGFNDSDADIEKMAVFLNGLEPRPAVSLLPFHRLAVSKQDLFDRKYPFADQSPTPAGQLERAASHFW